MDVHHAYDAMGGVLYRRDGRQRNTGQRERILTEVFRHLLTENAIFDVAVGPAGNIYLAQRNRVVKVAPDGTWSVIAGGNNNSDLGDGGPAVDARLGNIKGVAVDAEGNVYIADRVLYRVRKIDNNGIINTVAGNGTPGSSGDGAPAIEAKLSPNNDVEVDGEGSLYIVGGSGFSNVIRKVSPNGFITTIAGGGTLIGDDAEGRQATEADFKAIPAIGLDKQGNLYISQIRPISRVWRVSPGGVLHTFAGVGTRGVYGNNGPAVETELDYPRDVVVDNIMKQQESSQQ